jgi:hypothetical protein
MHGRVTWSSQLSDSAAATYTLQNIFSKNSVSPAYAMDWIPVMPNVIVPTGVENRSRGSIPRKSSLQQNYPNPFNPSTTLSYELSVLSHVTLRVFDLLGREVAVFVDQEQMPGSYAATWNANGMASGIYSYQLRAGDHVVTKRMILLQ